MFVYVDDLINFGNDSAALTMFKSYMSDCIKMKELGLLKYFLGIEVSRSSSGLFMCQRKYTLDNIIFEAVGILGAKPSTFPVKQNHRLAHTDGLVIVDVASYRGLVGRLIYLVVTRSDLGYDVHAYPVLVHAGASTGSLGCRPSCRSISERYSRSRHFVAFK